MSDLNLNCYGVDCDGWTMIHPRATPDMLGYLPSFIHNDDLRPASEQFNERYVYGGWSPIKKFTKLARDYLSYPGDPSLPPIAERNLRAERIVMYPHSLVAIIQPDGTFEVARMD